MITVSGEFRTRDGALIPHSPPFPRTRGDISTSHDAEIADHTIVPPYSGERLNLHYAISVCLDNAENAARHRQHLQAALTAATAAAERALQVGLTLVLRGAHGAPGLVLDPGQHDASAGDGDHRQREEGTAEGPLAEGDGGDAADEEGEPGRQREHRGAQRAFQLLQGHGFSLLAGL
jgi:hypothetical protein